MLFGDKGTINIYLLHNKYLFIYLFIERLWSTYKIQGKS